MLRTLTRSAFFISLIAVTAFAQDMPEDILVQQLSSGPLVTDTDASRDLLLRDLDGDGDLDVIVVNLDQDNAIYWNDGTGEFVRETTGPLVSDGGNSRGVATGDIDGDGDLDVFIANSSEQVNFLYENLGPAAPGDGTGAAFERILLGPVGTDIANSRKPKFADVDGDGDLDIVVANFNGHENDLYLNQGGIQGGVQGSFARVVAGDIVSDGGVSYDCALGDIDADGDLDLYITNHDGLVAPTPGSANFLFTNDGAGFFTKVTTGPAVTDVANSLAAGFDDIDLDGDLDLFVGNDEFDDNDLYLNDGSGAFTAVLDGIVVVDRGESIGSTFADVDGDGDRDLLLANRYNQPNTVYLNRRDGTFDRQSFGPFKEVHADTYGVAVGDIDGDARADVVMANLDGVNVAYRGLGSQWADMGSGLAGAGGEPTLGSKGNLVAGEVVAFFVEGAAPSAATTLIVGFSPVFAPLKGGILVPSPDLLLSGLVTDATGALALAGKAPPGLPSGLDMFFQAWIADVSGPAGAAASNALHVITP